MNPSHVAQDMPCLLSQDLPQLRAQLDRIWAGQQEQPRETNWWLGLAWETAQQARTRPSRDWGQVAVSIYEYLAHTVEPGRAHEFLVAAMMLRGSLIRQLGTVQGDSLLDPGVILDWFYESVPLSPAEAEQQSSAWSTLPIEQVAELRRIKERLAVLRLLVESGHLQPDATLQPWLDLYDRLP
jgi:hypothetical protein